MRVRDALGISKERQRQATRVMQIALIGFFFVGVYEPNVGIAVNAALGIAVTQLPAVLERDYDIPLDPGLTLWITIAVFFHAFGTVGFPGTGTTPYQSIWWWDHLTHGISSTLVAAAGYATAQAFDEYVEDLYFPPRFMFVFILLVVLAAGVFWEVVEFAVSGLAVVFGSEAVLTQYGVNDTMLDLVFDTIGGILVAAWGATHLEDVVESMRQRLELSSSEESGETGE